MILLDIRLSGRKIIRCDEIKNELTFILAIINSPHYLSTTIIPLDIDKHTIHPEYFVSLVDNVDNSVDNLLIQCG